MPVVIHIVWRGDLLQDWMVSMLIVRTIVGLVQRGLQVIVIWQMKSLLSLIRLMCLAESNEMFAVAR